MRVRVKQEGLKLNGACQVLVYVDDTNTSTLGRDIVLQTNTETL